MINFPEIEYSDEKTIRFVDRDTLCEMRYNRDVLIELGHISLDEIPLENDNDVHLLELLVYALVDCVLFPIPPEPIVTSVSVFSVITVHEGNPGGTEIYTANKGFADNFSDQVYREFALVTKLVGIDTEEVIEAIETTCKHMPLISVESMSAHAMAWSLLDDGIVDCLPWAPYDLVRALTGDSIQTTTDLQHYWDEFIDKAIQLNIPVSILLKQLQNHFTSQNS